MVDLCAMISEEIYSRFNDQIAILSYVTKKMLYMTHFLCRKFAYIKKKQYLCSEFKTYRVMSDNTISSYQGFGHRVQLIQRAGIARTWAVVDNRRVLVSTRNEDTGRSAFLSHVASIVLQRELAL